MSASKALGAAACLRVQPLGVVQGGQAPPGVGLDVVEVRVTHCSNTHIGTGTQSAAHSTEH